MYQTGTINSLLDAVYQGDTSIAELKMHGDFGLGTFDLVDGELIVCDNQYYRADVNGKLSVVKDNIKSPFAVVNQFTPDITLDIDNHDFESLGKLLTKQFVSNNLIYAIKVTGHFKTIHLRSETCQTRPFKKLSESLPKLQHAYAEEEILGIMVGVWFPDYLREVNIPGFHFHFIDSARKTGGHVFDFELTHGTADIQNLKSLHLDLIDNDDFFHANLNPKTDEDMNRIENAN